MKKSFAHSPLYAALSMALLFLLLGLPACHNNVLSGNTAGSLRIIIADKVSTDRSIVPGISMSPASYLIEGLGPGAATFSQAFGASASATIENLAFGSWAVTVIALNASDTEIGEARATALVHSNQTTTLSMTVRPYGGLGGLSLTLSWPAADVETPQVVATLTPQPSGAARPLVFAVDAGSGTASFSASDVQTGYHTLVINLYDNGSHIAGAVETVRIVRDETTSGGITCQITKAGGILSLSISADMGDALIPSIAGAQASKLADETLPLSASIAEPGVSASYAWYVNGEQEGTGGAFSFDSSWPAGHYRLDLTAYSADGARGGSATTNIEVLADTILAKIVAAAPSTNSGFGAAAAIDGEYAIVGALGESSLALYAGAAYIYHRTSLNGWGNEAKLFAADHEADDRFANSVSISGDYAIAGAYMEDSGGTNAGAAYIYHRTGANAWDGGYKIMAPLPEAEAQFGYSVAISGDYAIVGARGEDTGGGNAGAAYIFQRSGTNSWGAGTRIMATDPEANDQFGSSVAIDGGRAIVGAPYESSGALASGASYIYQLSGGSWTGTKLAASDPAAANCFGFSVDIAGDYAIAGTFIQSGAGKAYIYHNTGSGWGVGAILSSPTATPLFGFSVSIAEGYAVIGSPDENTGAASSGAACIYERTGSNSWAAGTVMAPTAAEVEDVLGSSVSQSGDYVVSGSPGDSASQGAAYIWCKR
jgi:hypothetical protein